MLFRSTASFIDMIGLWVVFSRFKLIEGWSLQEICLLYGLIHMSFALVEMFARGFDTFGRIIRLGQLDRILVRPRSVVLQILGQEFRTANIGRFLQGFIPFVYSVSSLNISDGWQWAAIGVSLFVGCALFYGLLLIQATLCFWAQDSIEVMNAFVYGGIQAGQLPMSIYDGWLVKFFIFIVPIGLCSYYPALFILNRTDVVLGLPVATVLWLSPLWLMGFLWVANRFFKFGLSRYTSTG